MRLKSILTIGLLGYGGVKTVQHRKELRAQFSEIQETFQIIQKDWQAIQKNTATIKQQLDLINHYKDDLDYQTKVFGQEAKTRLANIQEQVKKWQTN